MKEPVGVAAPEAQDLAARLAAGDPAAVAWLYDRVAPDLYQRLRRRYGFAGGPDAADLLQETFLLCLRDGCRLLRGCLAGQAPEAPALPLLQRYLWDLACGLAANARRSVWTRRVVAMPAAPLAAPEPPAERSAVSRDALARLDGCLEGSGERLYLYFKLRYVDGLDPGRDRRRDRVVEESDTYKLKQALNEAVERCVGKLGLALGGWLPALAALALLLAASACRREAPRLPVVAVVVRGNQDVLLAGRRPPPAARVVGRSPDKAALCFAAPAREDTSRWEAVLTFAGEASPAGFAAAAARAGSTLCFEGDSARSGPLFPAVCALRHPDRPLRRQAVASALPGGRPADPDSARIDGARKPLRGADEGTGGPPPRRAPAPARRPRGGRSPGPAADRGTVPDGRGAVPHRRGDPRRPGRRRRPPLPVARLAGCRRCRRRAVVAGRLPARPARPCRAASATAWLAFQRAEAKAVRIADPTLLAVVLQQADLFPRRGLRTRRWRGCGRCSGSAGAWAATASWCSTAACSSPG